MLYFPQQLSNNICRDQPREHESHDRSTDHVLRSSIITIIRFVILLSTDPPTHIYPEVSHSHKPYSSPFIRKRMIKITTPMLMPMIHYHPHDANSDNEIKHLPTTPTSSRPSPKTATSSASSTSDNPAKPSSNYEATPHPSIPSNGPLLDEACSHLVLTTV